MMLAPLLNASPVIQAHAFFALAATAVGAVQLAAPKGTLPHRSVGWLWATLMMAVVGTSFFIHTIRMWGPWSPIHLLSLFTLAIVPIAVMSARRHDVRGHRVNMMLTYGLALIAAGLFTLAPGRIMHAVVFGN